MPKITFLTGLTLAAMVALAGVPSAQAQGPTGGLPLILNPGALTGNAPENSKAIYAFADAANTSRLNLILPVLFGGNPIFSNHPPPLGGLGATVDLGPQGAGVVFQLNNVTTGTFFDANVGDGGPPNAPTGAFHAYYDGPCSSGATCATTFLNFGVGPLSPSVIAAIDVTGADMFTIVGWEDLTQAQGSDWDYNDLIFVFSNVTSTSVPEPSSLALLGAALVAVGVFRRRSKVT